MSERLSLARHEQIVLTIFTPAGSFIGVITQLTAETVELRASGQTTLVRIDQIVAIANE